MRKIIRDADLHKKYNLQRPTLLYIIKEDFAHVGYLSSASGSSKISYDTML